ALPILESWLERPVDRARRPSNSHGTGKGGDRRVHRPAACERGSILDCSPGHGRGRKTPSGERRCRRVPLGSSEKPWPVLLRQAVGWFFRGFERSENWSAPNGTTGALDASLWC